MKPEASSVRRVPSMRIENMPLTAAGMAYATAPREADAHQMARIRHRAANDFASGPGLRKIRPMENLMTLILTRVAAVTFGVLAALLKR